MITKWVSNLGFEYIVVWVGLMLIARITGMEFSPLCAATALFISVDVMRRQHRLEKKISDGPIRSEEKTLALRIDQVSEDHFKCELGDIRKLESGWMIYPHKGQIQGPFESAQEAVTTLARNSMRSAEA